SFQQTCYDKHITFKTVTSYILEKNGRYGDYFRETLPILLLIFIPQKRTQGSQRKPANEIKDSDSDLSIFQHYREIEFSFVIMIKDLNLSPPIYVDYRTTCFCHQKLLEICYVCFCVYQYSAILLYCRYM
ncbi:hypothetical protein E2I00_006199, partial [Balaenoptera physalus]